MKVFNNRCFMQTKILLYVSLKLNYNGGWCYYRSRPTNFLSANFLIWLSIKAWKVFRSIHIVHPVWEEVHEKIYIINTFPKKVII